MCKSFWRPIMATAILFIMKPAFAGGPIFLPAAQPPVPASQPLIDSPVPKTLPVVKDQYIWPSVENLSKLYWRLGKFTPDDKAAVDGFMIINECDIYKNYYNNDIEWAKIRQAGARDIINSVATYPVDIEILMPLQFGQYNPNEMYFEVTPDTSLNRMRRFEVFPNKHPHICNSRNEMIPGYPNGLIVNLDELVTIKAVPLKPDYASWYFQNGQQNLGKKRDAYVRLKVHLVKYEGTEGTRYGDVGAVVSGHLEGMEIYADPNEHNLLYRLDGPQFKNIGEIVMTTESPDPTRPAPAAPTLSVPPAAPAATSSMPMVKP